MSEAPPLLLLAASEYWAEIRVDIQRPVVTLNNKLKGLRYFKYKRIMQKHVSSVYKLELQVLITL